MVFAAKVQKVYLCSKIKRHEREFVYRKPQAVHRDALFLVLNHLVDKQPNRHRDSLPTHDCRRHGNENRTRHQFHHDVRGAAHRVLFHHAQGTTDASLGPPQARSSLVAYINRCSLDVRIYTFLH